MVKLENTPGKSLEEIAGGAYDRCFGDVNLGRLISRIQSLIISNGYELEKIITSGVQDRLISNLDEFLSRQIMEEGIRVAIKKDIKKSNKIEGHSIEPDFLIFERVKSTQNCYIVELKDGHEFDTKSSSKEQGNLHTFLSKNAMALQYYQSFCKIVGFNAKTKEEIRTGFKNKIDINQAMPGKEFCKLLGLDYKGIVRNRALDAEANFENFVDELLKIESVRIAIIKRLED